MDSVITCLLFHKFTQSLSHFCCLDSHFRCLDSHFCCLDYEYIYLLFQTLWQYTNIMEHHKCIQFKKSYLICFGQLVWWWDRLLQEEIEHVWLGSLRRDTTVHYVVATGLGTSQITQFKRELPHLVRTACVVMGPTATGTNRAHVWLGMYSVRRDTTVHTT